MSGSKINDRTTTQASGSIAAFEGERLLLRHRLGYSPHGEHGTSGIDVDGSIEFLN